MRLKTRAQLEAEKQAEKRTRETKIDRTKLALLYCRQSTKKQTVRNKESALSQTVGAKRRATEEYGFSETLLVLFIENSLDQYGNKLDMHRWRSVSGSLDKNFRAGLRVVEQFIEADKAGAVFVDDVSRLFRDETGINPRQFATACKDHNVVVVTEDRVYDFNATARDDYKSFVEEADEAADYLSYLRKTMQRRREKKASRGGYIGHPIPVGHMLTEDRSSYEPNPHWAPVVKRITKRFRELNADFATLRNEVRQQAIFPDLPEDFDLSRIGRIQLTKVEGGYTVLAHRSLVEMLTNVANIGHKAHKGKIVERNTHPAIVDLEDFQFALERLGSADLDGNEIKREQRAKRYTHGQDREGLLSGIRLDGRPVVTSSHGNVYVWQPRKYTLYTIRDHHDLSPNPQRGSISLERLDTAISRRLEEKLHALVLNTEVEKELGGDPKHGAQAVLNHVAAIKQRVHTGLVQIDKTITAIEKDLSFRQREYDVAKHVMADEDIQAYFSVRRESLDRLSRLREKRAQENRVYQDVEIVEKRLRTAREQWADMDLEQRRAFIRLITNNITLDLISGRFMQLTIEWSPVLAGEYFTEYALFFRGPGVLTKWKPQEDALLRDMFPQSPKSDILAALPHRSWSSIKLRAPVLHLKREMEEAPSTIVDSLSREDLAIVQAHNIYLEWLVEGYTEYWGIQSEPAEAVIKGDVSLL